MSTQVLSDDQPTPDALDQAPLSAAACNDGTGELTSLFFSEDLLDIARAKHVCSTCPVRTPCLEDALERREPWGVWGGELLVNGRVLAHKRRRGRPPKSRPAEVVVLDGVEVLVAPAIQSA